MTSDVEGQGVKPAVPAAVLKGLAALMERIGDPAFEPCLSALVESACGADQLYLFYAERDEPRTRSALSADGSGVAADIARAYADGRWWRFDKTICDACTQACSTPRLYQTDIAGSSSDLLRSTLFNRMQLCDRIMVCGRASQGVIGISMLRSVCRGPFNSDQRAQVEWLAQFAFPLVTKHCAVVDRDRQLSRALTDLLELERYVALAPEAIPPREAAVCARYLFGQSAADIGVGLDISRETVVTYRRRLYDRLGIGSHRELLLWYLDLYGSLRSKGYL